MSGDKQEDEQAIDGFTWGEIRRFVYDSVVTAKCSKCGAEWRTTIKISHQRQLKFPTLTALLKR